MTDLEPVEPLPGQLDIFGGEVDPVCACSHHERFHGPRSGCHYPMGVSMTRCGCGMFEANEPVVRRRLPAAG